MKTFKNVFRTVLALLLSFIIWMVSGLLYNSLPVLLCVLLALSYYILALLIYFAISGNDKISRGIGIFVSICFAILDIFYIFDGRTDWFMKIVFAAGLLSGIGATPTFFQYKREGKFSGGALS